jgi:hypothetical protein
MLLHRYDALLCPACHIHNPSRHKPECPFLRFEPCRSRWFWLSPHDSLSVACVTSSDLSLVEGWILAHETGEGGDGFGILGGILSLLSVASPRNEQGVLTPILFT